MRLPLGLACLAACCVLVLPAVFCPATGQAAKPYKILWQYTAGGKAVLPPVVSPWGDVFLCAGNAVQRLDPNGRLVWSFNVSGGKPGRPLFFSDGSVFLPTDKALYEIKPYGRQGWSFGVLAGEQGKTGTPAAARGPGDLFYVLMGRSLYAVVPRRNMVWYVAEGDTALAVDGDRHRVYLVHTSKDAGATLVALDGTGQTVWRRGFGETSRVSLVPAPDGRILYALLVPGKTEARNRAAVYALDTATGAQVWRHSFPQQEFSELHLAADGTMYLVADKRHLIALDAATGEEKFSLPLLDLSGAAPAADRQGIVYVPGKERLYAVSSRTGRLLWEDRFEGGVPAPPAVAHDGLTVYFVTGKGVLYALQAEEVL
ncbi:MAG: outer membrane protein assembly factor BamB family protein [Desulfotomaculales bacterium]